ncbi:DUF402 domain-containing protein [Nocardia takedensis]|uniref:DUF402 domain-containing protein n=1 Tax=Nocardia takedensis TaxID=259390 RepID=UPI000592A2B2|nr:DUF402 domain-containing protein [Nocardia takedensis]
MTQAPEVHVHKPKVEHFDVPGLTNTDPKGLVRQVERYHVEPFGLYMARSADHPEFHYLESWLLPELALRATIFHYRPEHRRDQNYYLDLGEFTRGSAGQWTSVDHYLDIVVRTGRDLELLDVDELLAAHAAGLLGAAESQAAIERATAAIDGIAANGYSLERWLETLDITLTWK